MELLDVMDKTRGSPTGPVEVVARLSVRTSKKPRAQSTSTSQSFNVTYTGQHRACSATSFDAR